MSAQVRLWIDEDKTWQKENWKLRRNCKNIGKLKIEEKGKEKVNENIKTEKKGIQMGG